MVKNKRGWMRILEATIAVMLVSGVLIVVYSQQSDRKISSADYFYNLQRQILADISSRSDLRLAVLNTAEDTFDDDNFVVINNFVGNKTPEAFGYYLRICDFGDVCKMRSEKYRETLDKDIFVEDVIISAELGNGNNGVYGKAKMVRFFIWELR